MILPVFMLLKYLSSSLPVIISSTPHKAQPTLVIIISNNGFIILIYVLFCDQCQNTTTLIGLTLNSRPQVTDGASMLLGVHTLGTQSIQSPICICMYICAVGLTKGSTYTVKWRKHATKQIIIHGVPFLFIRNKIILSFAFQFYFV